MEIAVVGLGKMGGNMVNFTRMPKTPAKVAGR
jgi:6-phosphogluconate dehydrogenase (decarboxylating)